MPEYSAEDVKIVTFEPTRVGAFEYRGDPRGLDDSLAGFIAWRRQNGLPPQRSATFNVAHTPLESAPDKFRFDVCAAIDRPVEENSYGIVEKTIPGGRCAVLRHVGSEATLGQAIRYLCIEWLPASGEKLREFPLFMQRVSFVPVGEAITDVFLPLQ
jgi:AraC family transcriptional regulator